MHDHDSHAPAPAAHAGASAADPDRGAWLAGTLLFLAALTALFTWSARHGSGVNRAPAPVVHGAAHGPAAPVKPSDEQRTADILAALSGHGAADARVSDDATADVEFVILTVLHSGCTFKLDGEPKSAVDVAEWLLQRWQNATDPIYSAEMLLARTTGQHLVDLKLNRVVFPDGSEKPLTDWLLLKLSERNGTPPPLNSMKPALPAPRTGKKTPK